MNPEELEKLVRELEATNLAMKEMRESVIQSVEGVDAKVEAAIEKQMAPHLERQAELERLIAKGQEDAEAAAVATREAAEEARIADEVAKRLAPLKEELQKRADELKLKGKLPPLVHVEGASPDSPEAILARKGGFESIGEMVKAIRFENTDPRLGPLHERAMSMGVGAAGGFLVPDEFLTMLTAITPQDAIVRPRAQVIPAGASPDATVNIPADDQGGAKGVYSGVTVVWTGEGADKTEDEPALRQLELTPHEVSAYTILSDKLLRNAAAAGPYVESKLRGAVLAAEDQAFINGTGVNQPLGFLGHASQILAARAAPNTIAYADVVGMYASILKRQGAPVWIGNPTTLPQLMTMATALGQLVWQVSAREGEPDRMLGLPFLRNERQPVLGTAGDLMLVNLLHYVIKDGAAMTIDVSEHVHFLKNQSVIRIVWNVDGQPTLASPLLLEDGASSQSPFVVLAA